MNKMKLKITLLLAALLLAGSTTLASEVTGSLTTGIGSPDITGTVIAVPIANPPAGTYAAAQSVTLARPTGATSVRYATDGTLPTCSTGLVYSGAIAVESSLTIKALSCYPNSQASTVAAYSYVINLPSSQNNSGGGGSGGGGSARRKVSVATTTSGLVLGAYTGEVNNQAALLGLLRELLAKMLALLALIQ